MSGRGVDLLPSLIDEVLRLSGRLSLATAHLGEEAGLSGSQLLVLTAVVRAERPPTVPQIGRSLGHSRQAVQRLAYSLEADGMIDSVDNPDHKRAHRLVATERGRSAYDAIERRSRSWSTDVTRGMSAAALEETIRTLHDLRTRLESRTAAA